jgi:hypothetical protein
MTPTLASPPSRKNYRRALRSRGKELLRCAFSFITFEKAATLFVLGIRAAEFMFMTVRPISISGEKIRRVTTEFCWCTGELSLRPPLRPVEKGFASRLCESACTWLSSLGSSVDTNVSMHSIAPLCAYVASFYGVRFKNYISLQRSEGRGAWKADEVARSECLLFC